MIQETRDGHICPQCGNEYKQVVIHWARSSACDRPEIPEKTREILTGLYLSGAAINRSYSDTIPRLIKGSVRGETINHFAKEMGFWCSGTFERENDKESIEKEFGHEVSEVQTIHRLESRNHPFIEKLDSMPPSDIKLTRKSIRIIFAFKGATSYSNQQTSLYVSLSKGSDLPEVFEANGWDDFTIQERVIHFNSSNKYDLVGMLGDPIPGYEDKWEKMRSDFQYQ